MAERNWRLGLLAVGVGVALAGCLPKALEPRSKTSPWQEAPNTPPTISGTPVTTATLDDTYEFVPVAEDPEGQPLSYSIRNKPAWASFNSETGQLTGKPTAGSPNAVWNILITVTDSAGASTSLPAFSIAVGDTASVPAEGPGAGGPHDGSATLSWTPATEYTDGSALPASDLTAYRIYHGRNEATLRRVAEVDGATTAFSVTNLAPGNHLFAVTAVVLNGIESSYSEIGSKYLP
jgi:hypothetical protein